MLCRIQTVLAVAYDDYVHDHDEAIEPLLLLAQPHGGGVVVDLLSAAGADPAQPDILDRIARHVPRSVRDHRADHGGLLFSVRVEDNPQADPSARTGSVWAIATSITATATHTMAAALNVTAVTPVGDWSEHPALAAAVAGHPLVHALHDALRTR